MGLIFLLGASVLLVLLANISTRILQTWRYRSAVNKIPGPKALPFFGISLIASKLKIEGKKKTLSMRVRNEISLGCDDCLWQIGFRGWWVFATVSRMEFWELGWRTRQRCTCENPGKWRSVLLNFFYKKGKKFQVDPSFFVCFEFILF